jgi:ferredoxin--NADP+ reductase
MLLDREFVEDVSSADLLARYHVVYAMGTSSANALGIPREDLPGCHAATEFVAWYNGHPDNADDVSGFSVDRVVVVGKGNVALDVARMLVLDPSEVAVTDTADHAVAAFADAAIREVVLVGRHVYSPGVPGGRERRVILSFLRSPIEILGTDRVEGIRLAINARARRRRRHVEGLAAPRPSRGRARRT